ncbi:MAG: hypothetical protein SAL70_37980 [Scytonema sp. PMC 1070.18]|nr:hypothetical protein [Scytonema sp. PMC 1070.18]
MKEEISNFADRKECGIRFWEEPLETRGIADRAWQAIMTFALELAHERKSASTP